MKRTVSPPSSLTSAAPGNLKPSLSATDSAPRHSEFVSVARLVARLDIDRSTFWRWQKRGWFPPSVNIAGRSYLPAAAVADFEAKAMRGEFKGGSVPPRSPKAGVATEVKL